MKSPESKIKVKRLENWLLKTVNYLDIKEKGRIEISFISNTEIKKLNKKFRGKDKETDILSFSFWGQEKFPGDDLIGQLFLAEDVCRSQANDNEWTFENELDFLFVHGVLHIFGYDHETKGDFDKMFEAHLKIMKDDKESALDKKREEFVSKIRLEYFGS